MSSPDSRPIQPVGSVADDHEVSHRARRYGERVVRGDEWPLDGVDLGKITWATSMRAKRRHGRCSYDGQGEVTITLTEHTYDRAGFAACKTTIRHELVHAWQYQHRGERAVVTDSGVDLCATADTSRDGAADWLGSDADTAVDEPTAPTTVTGTETVGIEIDTGHGDSFRAWVEPLDLPGRCSTYYERRRSDFAYVYDCPDCGSWWGKHRLCKSVRQAAHGGEGATGYRYCTDCEVLLHLRVGDRFLAHGDHDDATIKAFAAGDWRPEEPAAGEFPTDVDLPVVHRRDLSGIDRPR